MAERRRYLAEGEDGTHAEAGGHHSRRRVDDDHGDDMDEDGGGSALQRLHLHNLQLHSSTTDHYIKVCAISMTTLTCDHVDRV